MRKNCQQTMRAFRDGRPARPAESIWTDGETVWSYSTAILTRLPLGGGHGDDYALNRTRYSVTTTIHQNAIAADLPSGLVVEVEGLRQGATRGELMDAYHAALETEGAV